MPVTLTVAVDIAISATFTVAITLIVILVYVNVTAVITITGRLHPCGYTWYHDTSAALAVSTGFHHSHISC